MVVAVKIFKTMQKGQHLICSVVACNFIPKSGAVATIDIPGVYSKNARSGLIYPCDNRHRQDTTLSQWFHYKEQEHLCMGTVRNESNNCRKKITLFILYTLASRLSG